MPMSKDSLELTAAVIVASRYPDEWRAEIDRLKDEGDWEDRQQVG